MRFLFLFGLSLLVALRAGPLVGQQKKGDKKDEAAFVKEKPAIGDTIPDLTVYSPDGKEVKTSDLRGQHVVLVFGCLT